MLRIHPRVRQEHVRSGERVGEKCLSTRRNNCDIVRTIRALHNCTVFRMWSVVVTHSPWSQHREVVNISARAIEEAFTTESTYVLQRARAARAQHSRTMDPTLFLPPPLSLPHPLLPAANTPIRALIFCRHEHIRKWLRTSRPCLCKTIPRCPPKTRTQRRRSFTPPKK